MDYNRMVAYIYSYNDGQKCKNTGFAKIEVSAAKTADNSAKKNHIVSSPVSQKFSYKNSSYEIK